MRYQLILFLCAVLFFSCKQNPPYKYWVVDNKHIAMPEEYRKFIGYDSIQLISMGDDTLWANFCYPNQWEQWKFKKDTVKVHDTIYISPKINHVDQIIIGGN